jgi:RimJ/RimL family protein N-acetyltransferase
VLQHNGREFIVSVPYLQSERLILREYRLEDFNAFASHFADPKSAAYLALVDRDAALSIFSSQAGLWTIQGAGWWAVEVRETGQLAGNVGAFFREGAATIELGWNTYRALWGQGFASEAAELAMNYALEVRREPKIRALIDPGNKPSLRVAQHLGLIYEAETELYGKAVGCYTRERKS